MNNFTEFNAAEFADIAKIMKQNAQATTPANPDLLRSFYTALKSMNLVLASFAGKYERYYKITFEAETVIFNILSSFMLTKGFAAPVVAHYLGGNISFYTLQECWGEIDV